MVTKYHFSLHLMNQIFSNSFIDKNLIFFSRASVHCDLAGWTKEGLPALKARCEELKLQPRGTRGESGGQTGITYDISNKHRLGYSEVNVQNINSDKSFLFGLGSIRRFFEGLFINSFDCLAKIAPVNFEMSKNLLF